MKTLWGRTQRDKRKEGIIRKTPNENTKNLQLLQKSISYNQLYTAPWKLVRSYQLLKITIKSSIKTQDLDISHLKSKDRNQTEQCHNKPKLAFRIMKRSELESRNSKISNTRIIKSPILYNSLKMVTSDADTDELHIKMLVTLNSSNNCNLFW